MGPDLAVTTIDTLSTDDSLLVNIVIDFEAAAGLVDIIAASLRQKSFEASATAVVTELANRLSSNRVSIGFIEGPEIRIHAISQTAEIEKKTNLVRGIAAAMQEAITQVQTIAIPSADGTPSLSIAHKHLAEQFGARTVLSIPISHDGESLLPGIQACTPN